MASTNLAEETILGKATPRPGTSIEARLTVIKIIFALITAILRAASSSFVLLASTLLAAVGIFVFVAFLSFGFTGVSYFRYFRRPPPGPDQP